MGRRAKSSTRESRTHGNSGNAGSTPARLSAVASPTLRGDRRWPAIDFFRGCAIVAMVIYHFCFDLAYNGWLVADFARDLRWIWFRIPILGSFLFIAGVSLGLAPVRGQTRSQFWRRVAIIAAAAALVSLGSYLMFPESFIWFGVLHAIALMSVLARPALRWGGWLIGAGLAVLAIGASVQLPFFDQPALRWIGLMTFKPRTEDYVPLFPWFGMLLIGAGAGAWTAAHQRWSERLAAWSAPPPLRWMGWLGRHSLAVYLLHQPLMMGAMLLLRRFM